MLPNLHCFIIFLEINAMSAAAKSLQLSPTLCDPIDSSPPGFPIPGILQARTLEWVAIIYQPTKTVDSPWPVRSCWPAAFTVPMSSLLFVLNKLTPFCNILCLEILFQLMLRLPQHQPGVLVRAFLSQGILEQGLVAARTICPEDLSLKIPCSSTSCPSPWQLKSGTNKFL